MSASEYYEQQLEKIVNMKTLDEFLNEIERLDNLPKLRNQRISAKIIREMNNTLLYFRDVGEKDLGLNQGELLKKLENKISEILIGE